MVNFSDSKTLQVFFLSLVNVYLGLDSPTLPKPRFSKICFSFDCVKQPKFQKPDCKRTLVENNVGRFLKSSINNVSYWSELLYISVTFYLPYFAKDPIPENWCSEPNYPAVISYISKYISFLCFSSTTIWLSNSQIPNLGHYRGYSLTH